MKMKFNNIIDNKISGSNWASYLKLYIAEANDIDKDTTLEVRLVSGSWNNGNGQYMDSPQTTDGVSWNFKLSSGSGAWVTPGGDLRSTPGPGGVELTQSYDYRSPKDLELDVTVATNMIYNNLMSMGTDAFMVKLIEEQEFISDPHTQTQFQFYSVDTNTIYPPCLEFRWDDFTYETGSLNEIDTKDLFVSIDNNPGTFRNESVNEFRLNVRPTYPTRTYQTSSLYTSNSILPTSSYYAIKDLDTNEFVINFDSNFTKISCDDKGNFFTIYMNGLEPERYYKILIKTEVNGNVIVKDDNYYFKVING